MLKVQLMESLEHLTEEGTVKTLVFHTSLLDSSSPLMGSKYKVTIEED